MKKLKKEKTKTNKSRLILFGSFLIIGICTLTISLTLLNNYKNDKEEDKNLNDFFEVQEQINIEQKEVIEEKQEQKEEVKHYDTESYLGVLEIKKIGLTKGFYSINSKNNRVNKTIQIIKESKMPDEDKGNLIIAGHSGNAYISYFRYLNKLNGNNTINNSPSEIHDIIFENIDSFSLFSLTFLFIFFSFFIRPPIILYILY